MLRVDVQSAPEAVKLLCTGRIVLGVEAETLRCLATARPERCLILDLRAVHAIDAAGLGLLAELHCWTRERNGQLTIANPSLPVRRLLILSRLQAALTISYSAAEAAAAGQASDDDEQQQAMTA